MKHLMIALMLLLAPAALADETTQPARMADDAMIQMVHDWYRLTGQELNEKGEAGIPAVMALMHYDMRYLHPEFGANYDRELLIDGFKRRLKRAGTRNGGYTITNMITGKNMLVTKRDITYERKTDNGWEKDAAEGLTTLFEFKEGKIWRITEYWD